MAEKSQRRLRAYRDQLAEHLTDPLYRTGYLLTAGGGVTAVLGFVFWLLAARSYKAHVIGINSAALAAMVFIASICQLGLPNVLLRDLPLAGSGVRRLISRSYVLSFITALAAGVAAAATSGLWSNPLHFLADQPVWLVGFAFATAFYAIFMIQDYVMTGLDAPQWVPVENSLFSLAKLVILVAIVSVSPVAGPFIAWSIPAVVAALLITALIFRRLIPSRRRLPPVTQFDSRRFVSMAAANQVAMVFSYVVTLLMPVIVSTATNPTTTAYFYVPWTIAAAIMVPAVNSASSLTLESSLDANRISQLTRRTIRHTLRLIAPVALILALISSPLLHLYGGAYADHGTTLLRLLAIGTIPNVVYTIGEGLLRIQQRPVALVFTQAGQATLFLGLTLWLIHPLGVDGIGYAFLASQVAGVALVSVVTLRSLLISGEPAPSA